MEILINILILVWGISDMVFLTILINENTLGYVFKKYTVVVVGLLIIPLLSTIMLVQYLYEIINNKGEK